MILGLEAGLAASSRPTGVEYFARSLLLALLEQIPENSQLHLYLPSTHRLPIEPRQGLHLHLRPEMNIRLKDPWLAFRSWKDRLDLYYTFGHTFPAALRGKKVCTIYDTIYEELPECYPAGVPERQRAEVQAGLRQCWAVVSDSQATAECLRKFYSLTRPIIVTSAAARGEFSPGPGSPSLGARPYFLFVGRMDRRKNVLLLIQAYRQLLRNGADCALVLVGPDDYGSGELKQALQEGKVAGEEIVRPGYVAEAELLNLYRGACAFVYPSRAEGFGLPVLEAMACGTPVITSNCSALAEVAGPAAILVDPNRVEAIQQAMSRVLSEPELALRLRQDGMARAGTFSWESCAAKFWNGLKEHLNREK